MIRTGDEYRDSIRDNREVYMNGEPVKDVTTHPMFKPIVDIRARMYDMQHEKQHQELFTYTDDETGELNPMFYKPPTTQADWWDKFNGVNAVMEEVGGVVTRVGDETIGEVWSLLDGEEMLNSVDPRFGANIRNHVLKALRADPFHVSANTDPKGDRSKAPQDQDPDMLLHVVKETDAGIIVRGAKFETAAAYSNQAFVKPTIANWGNSELSDYAVGFICEMNAPGLKHICRTGFAGRGSAEDYPLSNKFDEVDTLIIFDNVLVPWENVLFYQHTKAATFIRATLHRYSAFPYTQRIMTYADMMIGTCLHNLRQTGLQNIPAVQENGLLLYFLDDGPDLGAVWESEFDHFDTAASPGTGLTRIDHLAQTYDANALQTGLLFYLSLLDLHKSPQVDIPDPSGLIQSLAIHNTDRRLRLTLNGADSGRTVAGRFVEARQAPGLQHVAFETRDIFATAQALHANGFAPLPISPNYFDDVEARFGIEPDLSEKLRRYNILYDQDSGGSFYQIFSQSYGAGYFFEIVMRQGEYDGYGGPNAPFRIAAQKRLLDRQNPR